MVAKKRGLGRGLDALLGADSRRPTEDSNQPAKSSLDEIPVE
ncbi:MAG: hypothetical protein ACI809_001451, partial [Candidatus Azotimanducaceae bacterium]